MNARHPLDPPSLVLLLFDQLSDVGLNLFIKVLFCHDASFGYSARAFIMSVQQVASVGTDVFTPSVICQRILSFTVSFFPMGFENWHAGNENLHIICWISLNFLGKLQMS